MSSVCHMNILAHLRYLLSEQILRGRGASDPKWLYRYYTYHTQIQKNNLIYNPIYHNIQNNLIPGKPFYIYICIYIRIHCLLINIILFIRKKEYNKYIVVYRNFEFPQIPTFSRHLYIAWYIQSQLYIVVYPVTHNE